MDSEKVEAVLKRFGSKIMETQMGRVQTIALHVIVDSMKLPVPLESALSLAVGATKVMTEDMAEHIWKLEEEIVKLRNVNGILSEK